MMCGTCPLFYGDYGSDDFPTCHKAKDAECPKDKERDGIAT